jgi:putative endonuclease
VSRAPSRIPVDEWTDPRHVLGERGEKDVLAYLVALGWRIEAHRYRAGRHDIDLVIRKGTLVAFVEVKTRSSGEFGSGVESVGWRKRKTLTWAAAVWVARHGQPEDRYRFDVVTVRASSSGPKVEHLQDAWRP